MLAKMSVEGREDVVGSGVKVASERAVEDGCGHVFID